MEHLCDANVWIAMSIEAHPHHEASREWKKSLSDDDLVFFNRATQTSYLRLLTQPIAPDFEPLSQSAAWQLYDRLAADDYVSWKAEPRNLEPCWRKISRSKRSSPKLWMDAYLAAFAIESNLRFVTFDSGFENFEHHGLDCLLLG